MFNFEIMSSVLKNPFRNPNHVITVKGSSSNHEKNHALTV